jgi:acetyl-CoA C-acetyltransferase
MTTVTSASPGPIDPRTPVIAGVGQASERRGEPGYQGLSPVALAAAAARAALADSGADPAAVARVIDTVAGVRQFEASRPDRPAPLGRADNYPRAVARRIGADPARAILGVVGGQTPQHLVTELAGAIAAGDCGGALVFGAEAISTVRHFMSQPAETRPDFTETVGGSLEDRGLGLGDLASPYRWVHGLTDPPRGYALLENARRARLGLSRGAYAAQMGALFAPFTKVAGPRRSWSRRPSGTARSPTRTPGSWSPGTRSTRAPRSCCCPPGRPGTWACPRRRACTCTVTPT